MKIRHGALVSIMLLVLAGESRAGSPGREFFNDLLDPGRRRGMTFHFEVGGGMTRVTAEKESWTPTDYEESKQAAGWIFGFGYAPLDQFIIHATIRWISFGDTGWMGAALGPFGAFVADEHIITGIGGSIYARRSIPSWFLTAGYGVSDFASPFDNDPFLPDYSGPGFFTGVGYEFTRHAHFRVELMWSKNSGSRQAEEGKWTCATLWATLGVVYY